MTSHNALGGAHAQCFGLCPPWGYSGGVAAIRQRPHPLTKQAFASTCATSALPQAFLPSLSTRIRPRWPPAPPTNNAAYSTLQGTKLASAYRSSTAYGPMVVWKLGVSL